jgi:hypothetical protein
MVVSSSNDVDAPGTLFVVDVLVLPDSAFAAGTSAVAGAAVVGAAVEFAVALVGDAVVGAAVVVAGAAVVRAAVDVAVAVLGDAVVGGGASSSSSPQALPWSLPRSEPPSTLVWQSWEIWWSEGSSSSQAPPWSGPPSMSVWRCWEMRSLEGRSVASPSTAAAA